MRIDHVIIVTTDLDRSAARLRDEHGLGAIPGGRHEGIGTMNRIVPLGGGYLELLAIADRGEAERSPFGSWALAALGDADEALMGWAVVVDEVAPHAERLGTPIESIQRAGLTAQNTGITGSAGEPHLPFFIQRGAGVGDPGGAAADHAVEPAGLAWLELSGDESRLRQWVGVEDAAAMPLRFTEGAPALRRFAVTTRDGGELVF
jgi:catechol 2,3-dioxygenase-like lactoylglutathione lyase family enzyme